MCALCFCCDPVCLAFVVVGAFEVWICRCMCVFVVACVCLAFVVMCVFEFLRWVCVWRLGFVVVCAFGVLHLLLSVGWIIVVVLSVSLCRDMELVFCCWVRLIFVIVCRLTFVVVCQKESLQGIYEVVCDVS